MNLQPSGFSPEIHLGHQNYSSVSDENLTHSSPTTLTTTALIETQPSSDYAGIYT